MPPGSLDYLSFLALRVAPPRLAALAARRTARSLRERLRPTSAVDDDRLLAGLSCRDEDGLAALLSRARPVPPPWTPDDLRRGLDRHLPGEAERALERAHRFAAGAFEVFGRIVQAGQAGHVDWQRDFLNGDAFDGAAPSRSLPPAPGLDPKAAWALARGDAWVALACGAALTPADETLPRALAASVVDFVRHNPVGRGVHWVTAMEVGLRAWNLLAALWIRSLRGPPEPALALAALRLLVASGRFIADHLEDDTAVPNNHLICDWLGLLACAAAIPEWPEAPRWRALALAGLREAAREQVLPDGLSFEGSLAYHRFSLELLSAAALLAHGLRLGLGRAFAARLHAMFRATRALLARSGELAQLGDNDAGHVFTVRDRGPTEGGYLLPLGAALLRDPALLVRPGAADAAEVAWLLGPGALEFVARARPGPPPGSAAFPEGGFHAVRRGRIEAVVACGPSGQRGIGGHSHNDKLALELFVDGERAVCDPGMPVYGRDPALRDRFRSTAVHATVRVDGLEQSPIPPGRPFALPDRAGARLLHLDSGPTAEHLAGEHRGFAARAGLVHRRDLWLTERGALVLDRLAGEGAHRIELRWPFGAAALSPRAASREERAALDALAALGPRAGRLWSERAVEIALPSGRRLLLAFAGPPLAPALVDAPWSPGYGQLRDGRAVTLDGTLRCPVGLATVLAWIR
jgi:hypothetical protein